MVKLLPISQVKKFYGNQCQLTNTIISNQLQRFRWIPDRKLDIYNHMLNSMIFRRDIALAFSNHKYTLDPEPEITNYNDKYGKYKVIVDGKTTNYTVKLPCASRYLIWFHYIKTMEKHRIKPKISSKRYITKYISKIVKFDWYNAYESYDDDVIMIGVRM